MTTSLHFVDVTVKELPLCMEVISVIINSQTQVTDIDIKIQPRKVLSCPMQVHYMFHLLICANQMLSDLVQKLFIERMLNCCNRCSYFIIKTVHGYRKKSVGRGGISPGDCGGDRTLAPLRLTVGQDV